MDPTPPLGFRDTPRPPKRVQGPPPILKSSRPYSFVYEPGSSLLESLFSHNPILSCLIEILTTPALLSLYCTSRTTRYYLYGQRRYFRNLFLIPDEQAERWVELKGIKGAAKESDLVDDRVMWRTIIDNLIDIKKNRIRPGDRKLLISGYLWDILKDDSFLVWAFKVTELDAALFKSTQKREPKKFFPKLMSRHLYSLLQTLPVGRRLTTLVLDGTGVETEYMKFVIPQIEGTLRGLSVKHCPNLECYTWSEWLLEVLEETRPIALQWLHIWGSGNTPTTDFDFTRQPMALEPLEPHEEDPPCWEFPTPDEWRLKASAFANVLPLDFHIHNTLNLLPAMTLTNAERLAYMLSLRTIITSQFQHYRNNQARQPASPWIAPKFPLGEPHPLIAILALAKYLPIELDVALCVSRRDCYSFVYGRPSWEHPNRPIPPPNPTVTVVHNTSGDTIPLNMRVPDDDSVGLHTHCVAEVGARREAGGTICQNCGLWEDELSPESFRPAGTTVKEYGGIKWGAAIGDGRTAVGNCCTDCVREMTCAGCNGFYCPSCVFRSPITLLLPANPLAAHPPSNRFLKWICPEARHGPHCEECIDIEKHFMTCIDCNNHTCYGCHGPTGITVSSSLYTDLGWDSEQENERFGVVGNISDWEEGSYLGWGGMKETEKSQSLTLHDSGNFKFWNDPTTSDCQSGNNEHEMDPEMWRRDPDQPSSVHDMDFDLPTSLSVDMSVPDADPADPPFSSPGDDRVGAGSRMSVPSPTSKASHLRMCETRIWERCSRCGVGTCAGCLGYEEDLFCIGDPQQINSEPEYRSCSGGCGRRFCESCLEGLGTGPAELVCGGVWEPELPNQGDEEGPARKTISRFDDPLARGLAGMLGNGRNDIKGGNRGRCGAVLCVECQVGEMLLRPTICQKLGEIEVWDPKERKGIETARRWNDRRGVWRCARCELGMQPLPR